MKNRTIVALFLIAVGVSFLLGAWATKEGPYVWACITAEGV